MSPRNSCPPAAFLWRYRFHTRNDIVQAKSELGWNPKYGLVEGLTDSYQKVHTLVAEDQVDVDRVRGNGRIASILSDLVEMLYVLLLFSLTLLGINILVLHCICRVYSLVHLTSCA